MENESIEPTTPEVTPESSPDEAKSEEPGDQPLASSLIEKEEPAAKDVPDHRGVIMGRS